MVERSYRVNTNLIVTNHSPFITREILSFLGNKLVFIFIIFLCFNGNLRIRKPGIKIWSMFLAPNYSVFPPTEILDKNYTC